VEICNKSITERRDSDAALLPHSRNDDEDADIDEKEEDEDGNIRKKKFKEAKSSYEQNKYYRKMPDFSGSSGSNSRDTLTNNIVQIFTDKGFRKMQKKQ
jgi:hypothetical protein